MQTVDPNFQAALIRAGGMNRFGEPNFRLVWSEDRLELAFGKWTKRYGNGRDRWVLEKWCPPEMYGDPETWNRTRDLETGELPLGPFPQMGEWEHSYTFEDDQGTFIQPTEHLIELVCRVIERGKMSTRSQKWAAIKQARDKREKDEAEYFDQVWLDSQGPFGGNAVSGIPSKRRPEDVRLSLTTKDLPAILPRKTSTKQL